MYNGARNCVCVASIELFTRIFFFYICHSSESPVKCDTTDVKHHLAKFS